MGFFNQVLDSIAQTTPRILLALLILVVGWIGARILSKALFILLARTSLEEWSSRKLGVKTGGKYGHRVERITARIIYYALLVLLAVLVLNVLDLETVNQPLIDLVGQILQALPKILLAVIIVLFAFVIGKVASFALTRLLNAIRIDERLGRLGGHAALESRHFARSVGELAFWFIMAIGVMQGLAALDMHIFVEPLQGALNELGEILPNLVGGILILVVGYYLARLVGRMVTNLLTSFGFDAFIDRIGLLAPASTWTRSEVKGSVDAMSAGAHHQEEAPNAEAGIGTAGAGAGTAGTRPGTTGATAGTAGETTGAAGAGPEITGAGADVAGPIPQAQGRDLGSGLPGSEGQQEQEILVPGSGGRLVGTILGFKPSRVVGTVVALVLFLLILTQVLSLIHLHQLSTFIPVFMVYLAKIGLALVILAVGILAGNWLKRRVDSHYASRTEGFQRFLGTAIRTAIILFASAMGLQQLGVAPALIVTAFGILFGAICLALALAFGLGGKEVAADLLQKEYARPLSGPTKRAGSKAGEAKPSKPSAGS